jgi:hypothetical protein
MRDLFGGDLRRARVQIRCLHKVGYGAARCASGWRCPVNMSGDSGVYDHVRFWIDVSSDLRFVTSEPYAEKMTDLSLAELRATCETLGLQMLVSDKSPYDPGRTKLIVIAPKDYAWPASLSAG